MSRKYKRSPLVWVIAAIFALNIVGGFVLLGLIDESSGANNETPAVAEIIETGGSAVSGPARQEMQIKLASSQGLGEITWSPDGMMAAYVKKSGKVLNAYIRKVGDKKERPLGNYPASAYGFFWAPNSKHILISGKSADGAVSRVIKVDTLAESVPRINSAFIPVWSPDGLRLVAAGLERDRNGAWSTIRLYTLGKKESQCLLRSPYLYGLYFIEYWDKTGIIGYSEVNEKGERIAKSMPAPQ